MSQITTPQIKKLHYLYRELGIDSKELLTDYTEGRTASTKDLTKEEATHLIHSLSDSDRQADALRKVIYTAAYAAGILYGDTEADNQMNRAKLDMFLKDRGTVKKGINAQSLPELRQTLKQMKAITRNMQQTKDKKDARDATAKLLKELHITVM